MTQTFLGGPILRAVSRSFYLSIRLLPGKLRDPIGLAYLLARTSDTIADSSSAPPAARLAHLTAFAGLVAGRGDRRDLESLRRDLREGCTSAEQALLDRAEGCLAWLDRIDPFDRAEIRVVMERIVRGQRLDLERFAGSSGIGITALRTGEELEEYTYLVAGCVGEFWTRECLHWLPHFSRREPAELLELGRDFGKGLQLVNILRDLPQDLRQGRCYLPGEELAAAGLVPADLLTKPAAARPLFDRWLAQAFVYQNRGAEYIAKIRPARVRMGCFLPWSLGVQTLRLLEKHPPLEASDRIKVSRRAVSATMRRAVWTAISNSLLGSEQPKSVRR